MPIKSIPDNQGWSAGGYNFYVAEDGNLTKGRPGETPTQLTGSLPDGATIGGVMYFNRPTKPTERSAGVSLVIGDRWYNTSDGTEWFWNGTYWLSATLNTQGIFRDVTQATTINLPANTSTYAGHPLPVLQGQKIFLESVDYRFSFSAPTDISNYWTLSGLLIRADGIAQTFSNADGVNLVSSPIFGTGFQSGTVVANTPLTPARTNTITYYSFQGVFTPVGSPASIIRPIVRFNWRLIN